VSAGWRRSCASWTIGGPTTIAGWSRNSPSFYFKRQFWGTFEDDRAGLLTRELIGVDRLMWGSDYPHTEGTFPHSREQIAKDFVGIPEKEIRMMVAENAAQLYGVN
jgi:predicted TIM-barrel fold metal-dependent hydrolase